MGVTISLIPDASSRFTSGIGEWVATGTTIARSTDIVDPVSGDPTLLMYSNSGSPGLVKFQTKSFGFYNGENVEWPLRGVSKVKTSNNGTVVVYLTTVEGSASTTISASATVTAGEWNLVNVETESIPLSTSLIEYGIYVTNTSSSAPAYIGHPEIISPWSVIYNFMARESWIRLPEYMRQADTERTELDRPLLRFIDVLMTIAGDIYDSWEGFRWLPPEENNRQFKLSELVTPSEVPVGRDDILQWLVQIVGARIFDPSTGLTPWENLDYDNIPLTDDLTWTAFPEPPPATPPATPSPFDFAPADNQVTWTEIQSYDVAVTDLDPFLRWQITSAAYGFRAGTKESIIAAAKQALGGTQTVTFEPHYNDDPWHIRLTVLSTEGDTGEVAQTVAPAMPAGYELTVQAI
jgi:hypothetical protein